MLAVHPASNPAPVRCRAQQCEQQQPGYSQNLCDTQPGASQHQPSGSKLKLGHWQSVMAAIRAEGFPIVLVHQPDADGKAASQ